MNLEKLTAENIVKTIVGALVLSVIFLFLYSVGLEPCEKFQLKKSHWTCKEMYNNKCLDKCDVLDPFIFGFFEVGLWILIIVFGAVAVYGFLYVCYIIGSAIWELV